MAEDTVVDAPADVKADAPAPAADAPAKGDKPAKAAAPASDATDYDWRGRFAGEDTKVRKMLDRYTDEGQFMKSFLEKDKIASDPRRIMIPGEDATDEDRASFNKSLGIPEDPKKYEIKTKPPEGMELTDHDKARLDAITTALHKAGGFMAHPNVVNEAHRIFYAEREEAESQMIANATIAKEKTEAMLAKLWPGQEKKRNMMLAEQAVGHFFGKDFAEIRDMQFADGTKLGDSVEFIQAMAKVGRMTMEDPVFLEAGRNGVDPYKSLQQEKADLMSLRHSKPQEYGTQRVQSRLQEIYAALERHDGRAEAQ